MSINEPGTTSENVKNLEGRQDLYKHTQQADHEKGVCGYHAQALEKQHRTTFADVGVHVEGEERPPERRWLSAGRGSCGECTRINHERTRYDPKAKEFERRPRRAPENTKPFVPLPPSLNMFTPKMRVFTHTCGLDHRLWDGEQLKPDVRKYILSSIARMWNGRYSEWSKWSRVYFAGSEASEWTGENLEGNNDFDVLVGVDYDGFRRSNPHYEPLSNIEITEHFNAEFKQFNGEVELTIDGMKYGPFDRTTYVNKDSYDIRKIKPYAAYNVSDDVWAVKPPHLPHWSLSKLPKAVQKVLRHTDDLVRQTLKLEGPEKIQQGAFLFDAFHTDRSRAFGPMGQGWYDIANLREKWLDQAGLWAQLVNCKHQYDAGEGTAAADWSNTPKTAAAHPLTQQSWFHAGHPDLRRQLHTDSGGSWLHAGTKKSAEDRVDPEKWDHDEFPDVRHRRIHEIKISPGARVCDRTHSDDEVNGSMSAAHWKSYDVHPYVNEYEDEGSTSIVVRPSSSQAVADHGRHPAWNQKTSALDGYDMKYQGYQQGGRLMHEVGAYHQGNQVGNLRLGHDGVVSMVHVHDDHRRKGVGSAMWDHAKYLGLNPQHSGTQTEEGEAWSQKTATTKMVRPSELNHLKQREDLDEPWNRHKIDDLKRSISENGFVHNWGAADPIRISDTHVTNGNKRLKSLRELGYDGPVPVEHYSSKTASRVTFDQLKPHEQQAASAYHNQMIDAKEGDPAESVHGYTFDVRQEPKKKFLKRYMNADDEFKAAYGPNDFQAHHEETLKEHPIPSYSPKHRWPLIVNDSNPNYVDDGYHRMHSYIRDGAIHLPTMRMHKS